MKIFGAGLAGLLAACHFQDAQVFEEAPRGTKKHKALLRFRSPDVGDAVGIEFKKVRVHKGIWHDGRFVQPNIRLANWYSQKVVGRLVDRSIWSVRTEDRWVAPIELHEMLSERCSRRITYNYSIEEEDLKRLNEPAISTLPIKTLHDMVYDLPKYLFRFPDSAPPTPICVQRYLVPGADAHQTVYFPSPGLNLYRASMVGDVLIVESVEQEDLHFESNPVWDAFGISPCGVEVIDKSHQEYGKISPIDEVWRKAFILHMSQRHMVYSLGRFATWRHVLLDDVLHDISVIRKLINSHPYDHSLAS